MSDEQKTEGEGTKGGEAQNIQTEQQDGGAQPAALTEKPVEEKPAEGDKAE